MIECWKSILKSFDFIGIIMYDIGHFIFELLRGIYLK